jgi:TonB family protein
MSKQDLPEAALTLQRLRELRPDYPELPLLETQLQLIQNAVVASHASAAVPTGATTTAKSPREVSPRPAQIPDSGSAREVASAQAPDPKSKPTTTRSAPSISAPSTADIKSNSIASPAPTTTPISSGTLPITNDASQSVKLSSASAAPLPPTPQTIEPAPTSKISEAAPLVDGPINDSKTAAPSTVVSPELVKYVPPNYPTEAFARGMEGWIQVGMEITPNGDVINAHIEDGEKRQLFGRAALNAVQQWKYASSSERTSSEQLSVRLEFRLK